MSLANTLLQNKSAIPSEFDTIARRYDIATWFSRGYMHDLHTSVSRMSLSGKETLLDLCCGTGKSTLACYQVLPQGKIIAVDNSSAMLEVARKKFSGKNVLFLQQDAMQLEFDDNTFDAIFMAYGIRNMPDYVQCLKGLYRILKPEGVVGFHEYILNNGVWARRYWQLLGYGFIIPFCTLITGNFSIFHYLVKSVLRFPDVDAFTQLLKEAGFSEINVMPLSGWRAPILKTVIARKA